MCWNEPSTLRLLRLARASTQVAARLTTTPTSATTSTIPPSTSGGSIRRRIALEQDQQREDEQRDAVGLCGEDLDALEAVGHDALRGPGGQPDRDQREADRSRVREHVAGVREQRQGAGGKPGDDLEHHEAEDQRKRDGELAAVGVGRYAVRVSAWLPCSCPFALTQVTLGEPRRLTAAAQQDHRQGVLEDRVRICTNFTRLGEFRLTPRRGSPDMDYLVQCGTTAILNRNLPALADRLRGELQHTGYVREPMSSATC